MKKFLIPLIIFSASINPARSQVTPKGKDPSLNGAVDTIEHYAAFYFEPGTTAWDYFLRFSRALGTSDLANLTDNWNYAARCYAFFALAQRHSSLVDSILEAHLLDTADVFILLGDDGEHQTVGDFFYNVVTDNFFRDVVKLDSSQKYRVDSLLIFRPGVMLKVKANLLQVIPPKPSWYGRLREIATLEKNYSAVVALSKYHNQQDLPLIKFLLESPDRDLQYLGLRSARNYPDLVLFPDIKRIHETEIRRSGGFDYVQVRMLYQTIVQFKDSASRQLLLRTLKIAKDWTLRDHSRFIWLALTKYPNSIYSDILPKLKIEPYRFKDLRQQLEIDEN